MALVLRIEKVGYYVLARNAQWAAKWRTEKCRLGINNSPFDDNENSEGTHNLIFLSKQNDQPPTRAVKLRHPHEV